MGNWIYLPDGRLVLINGIGKGTAGYGNTSWAIGQSFGDDPVHTIRYYDPDGQAGSRFSSAIANSSVDRMYHSSATLLPDGSVFSSGSNPNADFVPQDAPGYKYFTEYRVERFYPDYFTSARPNPTGLPTSLSYGGNYFDVTLSASDIGNAANLDNTRVTLIRPGFSTHAMNMGQRFLALNSTYSVNSDGSAVLHVSQMPPNPAIFVPGPALIFVVVNGVPSTGQWVTIGSGQLGTQPVLATQELPAGDGTYNPTKSQTSTGSTSKQSGSSSSSKSKDSSAISGQAPSMVLAALAAVMGATFALS